MWAYSYYTYLLREEVRANNKDNVINRTKLRIHIRYLTRYKDSNIYRIWVPLKAIVIRTRDINFVKDEFFDPKKEERPIRELITFYLLEESAP